MGAKVRNINAEFKNVEQAETFLERQGFKRMANGVFALGSQRAKPYWLHIHTPEMREKIIKAGIMQWSIQREDQKKKNLRLTKQVR